MNAAFTGAQVVYDRHKIKKQLDDHYITMQAYQTFADHPAQLVHASISASTLNRTVLITGQVNSKEQQKQIDTLIKQIENIKEVYNLTHISGTPSVLVQFSDAWITAKVKSKLIACNDIDPGEIKVITENGTVFLMGVIPPEQAHIAVDLARNTDGVQDVIKVFSYLRITKA
jgi:osmotically-inducible protein OsmY